MINHSCIIINQIQSNIVKQLTMDELTNIQFDFVYNKDLFNRITKVKHKLAVKNLKEALYNYHHHNIHF
jgi:hypothetical protein